VPDHGSIPTASQFVVVGHDTDLIQPVVPEDCVVHVAPPFDVAMIVPLYPSP
jgi:hypothetical protein